MWMYAFDTHYKLLHENNQQLPLGFIHSAPEPDGFQQWLQ